jgi:thiamine-monophosphate kinase
MPSEFELIARYFSLPPRHAVLGVGDDAAILRPAPGRELVVTTDMLVEGVHFFSDVDAAALGHKALAVNLSDLAAMGALPRYALLALALPAADETWLSAFANGFLALAEHHDVDLVGGDTTRGPLTICVQAMGEVAQGGALRRDGARPGDDVWLSGHVGDAAAAVAHRKGDILLRGEVLAACQARLDRPTPRIELGLRLAGLAHAAIDVSDGLVADLGHICERSGTGAQIEFAAVPCAAQLMALRHHAPVMRAILAGGDDYELCFTAEPARRAELQALAGSLHLPLTRIGTIVEGSGVRVRDEHGGDIVLDGGGFDHFRA